MKPGYFRSKRKFASAVAACALAVLCAPAANGAATDISDIPMAVTNAAAPNIMFTLDDSGSMQWEVLPDDKIRSQAYYMFPRADNIYGAGDYNNISVGFNHNLYVAQLRSSSWNKVYYNPAVRYRPWANADGTDMAQADPSHAYHNPANPNAGFRVLNLDNNIGAAQNTWLQDDGSGTVTDRRSFYPALYYTYNGGNTNQLSSYTRVEIRFGNEALFPSSATSPNRTDCSGRCTSVQEMQNFANWYSYYRSRTLTARAGVGRAFSMLGTEPRVGFAAINTSGTIVSGVKQFIGTDRTNFFNTLYGHINPAASTPLRRALDDVGQYFMGTAASGPWGPGTGSAQAYCRQNYNILMTDGYWNSTGANVATGNVDNTNGPTITNNNVNPNPPTYQYTPTSPYSDRWSNTLADVAMYYWNHDLRTDLVNKVPTNSTDPAFWQHLVNFSVSLGVTGSISEATIQSALTDPTHTSINWPQPDPVNSDPANVDDLAHAAVNSRGGYFSASDPETFALALTNTINNIIGREGGAAAVAVSNANVTGADNHSYASKYNSGNWSGDLLAYPINTTTGMPDETAPIWSSSAQTQLDARTSADRKIVTYTGTAGGGQGIQFQPTTATTTTKLSSTQQALLNSPITPPGPTDGANVVAYLRGDRSREGTSYRTRTHLLGDIINAEPLLVREPLANYADACYAAAVTGSCATSFRDLRAGRPHIVYQGANDGMLHAFNAATGAEEWAYVPSLLLSSLNNLSRLTGFTHQYYVDGTPVSSDVDFGNTGGATGTSDWHTIVVGGLNKGGRGYYALDVTCPTTQSDCTTPATEADIAAKVLWEFPNSATSTLVRNNIGYSFGKPVIVKTTSMGWVVLVTSGYNNGADTGGDGQGYLFVLDAMTGTLIRAIGTSTGNATSPSGLAQISAYVENGDVDRTATQVYGGDLNGNVWRFDLTASDPAAWSVTRLATLRDASGTTQPVTTAPELAKISNDKHMVYVGTGRYLGDSDILTTQTQTMYGLEDNLISSSVPVIGDPVRDFLQQQTLTTNPDGISRTASSTQIPPNKQGWYVDMPISGERINTDPVLALGVLVFTSNIPSNDICTPGGSSWLNVLDYRTGGLVIGPSVPWASTYLGEFLGSRPVLVKLPSGEVKALVRTSAGTTEAVGIPTSSAAVTGQRVSWRELLQ